MFGPLPFTDTHTHTNMITYTCSYTIEATNTHNTLVKRTITDIG